MLGDGWLRTGDIYTEIPGLYCYQGRADDMFKVDANWVSPTKVESVLSEHAAIMECAVASRMLEGLAKPVAHVVLNDGFTEDAKLSRDLRAHVLKKLPEYMCPVQIVFCSELPKTETGKIQRFRLLKGTSSFFSNLTLRESLAEPDGHFRIRASVAGGYSMMEIT